MDSSTLNSNLVTSSLLDHLKSLVHVKKILIAYSGGLDSHVLLHLFSGLSDIDVRAMHVHHGLLKEADSWVEHCQSICSQLNIPLKIEYLNLNVIKGESLEELARNARYNALKASLLDGEVLVTAHHQNDQTETLLLQLFRGAGVDGLAAMPLLFPFDNNTYHYRPLLHHSRSSLDVYAKENKLHFIEDPSNADIAFDRNYLRNNILPSLRKRWLGLDKTVGRSASIQAETKHLLDEFAAQDLAFISATDPRIIDLKKLSTLSFLRQKLAIRYWVKINGFLFPSEKKLGHLFTDIIPARLDAQPLLEWSNVQLRRYKDKLYIMTALSDHDASQVLSLGAEKPLIIESLGIKLIFSDLNICINDDEVVTIRFRQGGEKIFDPQRKLNVTLKNLLAEQNVPPWLRSRLPLVYCNNKLVKIIGLGKFSRAQ